MNSALVQRITSMFMSNIQYSIYLSHSNGRPTIASRTNELLGEAVATNYDKHKCDIMHTTLLCVPEFGMNFARRPKERARSDKRAPQTMQTTELMLMPNNVGYVARTRCDLLMLDVCGILFEYTIG